MDDFKLEFYYNLYKDKSLESREKFRQKFRKEHGEFEYLEKLIIIIENYQLQKYGCTLNSGYIIQHRKEECIRLSANERGRKSRRKI